MDKLWLFALGLLFIYSEAVVVKRRVNILRNVAGNTKPGYFRAKRSLLDDPVKLALLKTILDDEGPKRTRDGVSLRGVEYDNNCFPEVDFRNLETRNKYPRFEDCQSYYYFYEKETGAFRSEIMYCLETEIFDPKSGECLHFGHDIIPKKCQQTCMPRDLTKNIELEPSKMPIGVTDLIKIVTAESDFVSFYFKNFYSELLQAYIKNTNKYASEVLGMDDVDSYIPTYHSVSKRLDSVVRDVTFRLFYKEVYSRNAKSKKEFESDETVKQIKKLIQSDANRIVQKIFNADNSVQAKSDAKLQKRSGALNLKKSGKSSYNYQEPEGERLEINSESGKGRRRQTSTVGKLDTISESKSTVIDNSDERFSNKEYARMLKITEL